MNIKDALTRKIGPLPAWGWGAVIGVGGLAFKMLRGGGGGNKAAVTQQIIPTGPMQIDPSAGFLNELSVAIDAIRSRLSELPTTTEVEQIDTSNDQTRTNILDAIGNIPTKVVDAVKSAGVTVPSTTPSPPATTDPTPTPGPISAKPLSIPQAEQLLASIGAPTSWASSPFARANSYIFASADALKSWALRYARTPTSGYKVVDGRVVKE